MVIFFNSLFWSFFFMMGFVAVYERIAEFWPKMTKNGPHWVQKAERVQVAVSIGIVGTLQLLNYLNTSTIWTMAILQTTVLVYTCLTIKSTWSAIVMLGVAMVAWSHAWFGNVAATVAVMLVLGSLGILNRFRARLDTPAKYLSTVAIVGTLIWQAYQLVFKFPLGQTLGETLCFFIVMMVTYYYSSLLDSRKAQSKELVYENQHDPLTGVRNMAKFDRDFAIYQVNGRAGNGFACYLVELDIDHFKDINDTYGHLVGNEILVGFAKSLDDYINAQSLPVGLYRTGGEEFSLIIAGMVTDEQAYSLLDGFTDQLRNSTFETKKATIGLTVSVGITKTATTDTKLATTIARADTNMYAAKNGGRNRIVMV